jgi:hypothetical protein
MQDAQQFYLDNDGFYAEQKKRAGHGFPIGTYQLPTHGKIDVQLLFPVSIRGGKWISSSVSSNGSTVMKRRGAGTSVSR